MLNDYAHVEAPLSMEVLKKNGLGKLSSQISRHLRYYHLLGHQPFTSSGTTRPPAALAFNMR